jgi:hypothetical protein
LRECPHCHTGIMVVIDGTRRIGSRSAGGLPRSTASRGPNSASRFRIHHDPGSRSRPYKFKLSARMCQEPELITRRRRWSPTQKAALLEEVEDEGGKVAVVARRHGISESLLYNWRSAWDGGGI